MELITASTGEPHVSSADDGVLYASLVGTGSYVAEEIGDGVSCTMTNANTAAIGTGSGYINGRGFRIQAPEDVQIQSGSQLMNRNDIICIRYQKDGYGHESASLTVLQSTPTEGDAQDPTIPDGDILDGATDAYMPLWRIPIRGIAAEEPEQLFETFKPLKTQQDENAARWDSISLVEASSETASIADNATGQLTVNFDVPDGYTILGVKEWRTNQITMLGVDGVTFSGNKATVVVRNYGTRRNASVKVAIMIAKL